MSSEIKFCKICNQAYITCPNDNKNVCSRCMAKNIYAYPQHPIDNYCNRCGQECTYIEYMSNAGLCDYCAEILESEGEL